MSAPAPAPAPQLEPGWLEVLAPQFATPAMRGLKAFLQEERAQHRVYPPGREMFAAFWLTPFAAVRVVILGQDPYHGPGQAHGLAFSVRRGVPVPPSLQNIHREIAQELGLPAPRHGDLSHWARQGVLLLNTALSVRAHAANSHRGRGWEPFTDAAIEALATRREGLVFLLWGAAAGQKARMIDPARHLVLTAPHPSPLSAHRGFFGCGHFARTNAWLAARGQAPIDWSVPD